MKRRALAHRLYGVIVCCSLIAPIQANANPGTTISGRIVDAQGGLPITNASVELDRGGQKIDSTRTDSDGSFSFNDEPPGTYSFLIAATGYQTSRAPDLVVTPGEANVSFQTAIFRGAAGLRTIAQVATAGRTALQTTATISEHVDTSVIQGEDYQRLGDVLTTIPGITTSTSSSVGDDMSLSVRGFDSTETATLLDGHPIGPIGAFGGGYNYNVSPFFGLDSVDVIFGSGAAGLFGATTIAGAVDFETINPTQQNHFSITQGVGSDSKMMTGLEATGTLGPVGYAFAWGTQGTNGNFPGANITQNALLQTSVVHPPYCPPSGCNAPPPDLTTQNVNNLLNTYWVVGQYDQKNFMGKLRYDITPTTQLQLTAYVAYDWSNSTGEGDNDFETYPYVLYGAQQTIAGGPNTILVNGTPQTCTNSIAVLNNSAAGYTCMTAKQYAQNFYGPFGGSIDRWRTLGNDDYDARLTQGIGIGQLTLEGFADEYNYNEQKGPQTPIGTYTTYGPGPNYLDLYHNRGYLLSYDLPFTRNDIGFGYSWLRQSDTNGSFPYTLPNGNQILAFGNSSPLYLATASYFARDTWTPNDRLQLFGTVWVQRSLDTSSTNLDPRVAVMYRPDSNDVIRVAAGHSYSEPDPSLLSALPVYGAPSSINCPSSTSGSGALTTIANTANPGLQPETANDAEVAYGHRFNFTTNFQADVYESWENDALLNGNVSIAGFRGVTVPASYITQAINRLSACPGLHPTMANLAFSTTYNAAAARYRGIVLTVNFGLMRGVTLDATYNVQSAAYLGVPQDILMANTNLIDGGQIYGTPVHTADIGLSYQSLGGFGARIDSTYIGADNSWNRPPFWYANGAVSQAISARLSVNFGVQNIFDSAAQRYGLIGLGTFVPQNFYGSPAMGGPTSAIQQGTEEFGLPPRQLWFAVTART